MADDLTGKSLAGLDSALGFVFDVVSPDEVSGWVDVAEQHKQPFGLVHGGVYCALAESAAAAGSFSAVADSGKHALGVSNSTSFMRPVTEGRIRVSAVPRHQGRTTWVWDIEMTGDSGKLCAVSRVTVAIR